MMSPWKISKIHSLLIGGVLTFAFGSGATSSMAITCGKKGSPSVISCQPASPTIRLERLGTYRVGFFNSKGAEIVAHDPKTQRLFVVNVADIDEDVANSHSPSLDVLDISDPTNPRLAFAFDLSFAFDPPTKTVPTSVAVKRGIVAVTVTNDVNAAGKVLFFDTEGVFLKEVAVGPLADMVTFTPNGQKVLVANPGTLDPPGSISIIDITRGVERATVINADFSKFEEDKDDLIDAGVRIFTTIPGVPPEIFKLEHPVTQSLKPEFIAVSPNSLMAWVTLQINNAMAVVDIRRGEVTDILPLGVKDHSLSMNGFVRFDGEEGSNALDASDRDNDINIVNWPVFGMYQPDAIAAYHSLGGTFLVTANEGNHLEIDLGSIEFDERVRIEDLIGLNLVDPAVELADLPARLRVTQLNGDTDGDGDFDKLFAFGARSFSIWSENGQLVFDSGDDFEQITATAAAQPEIDNNNIFNPDDNENAFDVKSDDQGPEPEGITVGKAYGRTYAFTVLERTGGVMVYDVTDPERPGFEQYINNRDFTINIKDVCEDGKEESEICAAVGDLGPEGILFIPQGKSPIREPLLVIANETSSSTTIYRIDPVGVPARGRP